jgi:hypothetical protein
MPRCADDPGYGRPACLRRLACGAWPALLISAAGCQSYHWRTDYSQAEQDAHDQHRRLFIFYKWWLDEDSSRMLEVLSDRRVVAQFQDTINVLVERGSGPLCAQYMCKYGVNCFPAVVIVAPNGRFEARMGFLSRDRLLEFSRQVKASFPEEDLSPERSKPSKSHTRVSGPCPNLTAFVEENGRFSKQTGWRTDGNGFIMLSCGDRSLSLPVF